MQGYFHQKYAFLQLKKWYSLIIAGVGVYTNIMQYVSSIKMIDALNNVMQYASSIKMMNALNNVK